MASPGKVSVPSKYSIRRGKPIDTDGSWIAFAETGFDPIDNDVARSMDVAADLAAAGDRQRQIERDIGLDDPG